MATMHFDKRRARVLELMRPTGDQALFVSDPINVLYLTGFESTNAYVVLTRRETAVFTDGRYEAALRPYAARQKLVSVILRGALGEALAAYCHDAGIRTLAFEADHLTVAGYERLRRRCRRLRWQPADNWIGAVRDCKEPGELAQMRLAIAVAQDAFRSLRPARLAGMSERAIAALLEERIRTIARARGLYAEPSFNFIVACGPNAAVPHHHSGETIVRPPTILKIDWGARINHYCSDLTRTLFLGRPTARFREIYNVVKRAHLAAIAAVRPGVPLCDVDHAARRVITDAGFGDAFSHNTGHGVGMQIHEGDGPQMKSTVTARLGMVITIEPGIYLPGWGGIRLENMVLVTARGRRVLTTLPL